jgi:hypothetical protein
MVMITNFYTGVSMIFENSCSRRFFLRVVVLVHALALSACYSFQPEPGAVGVTKVEDEKPSLAQPESLSESNDMADARDVQEEDSGSDVDVPLDASEQSAEKAIETNPQQDENLVPLILGPDLGDFPPGYNPLTGLPASDPHALDLRPLFISISHYPPKPTRPTTGLSFAPWVFEIFIGKGQTRLFSLFYGGFPEIGGEAPANINIVGIRSGRAAYGDINMFYNACIIIGGASKPILEQLPHCGLVYNYTPDDIGGAGVNVANLRTIAEENTDPDKGVPNLSGNIFSVEVPEGGADAASILMFYNTFNQTKWLYDPEKGLYVRYEDNYADGSGEFILSTDRLTNEPLTRENVIVLFVKHTVQNLPGTIIDLDLAYNMGPAYLFRDGKLFELFWTTLSEEYEKTTGQTRPIRFVDENGDPFPLKPGMTWVNVVDVTTDIQDKGNKEWYIRFFQPEYMGN